MKKILVVSDTHGNNKNLRKLIAMHKSPDMLIHLGDGEGIENQIDDMVGPETVLYMVKGNNDFFSGLDRDMEVDIYGHRAFLTHGHMYGVSVGASGVAEEAASRGCELAFFGHTHRPFCDEVEGIRCINPGSLSYPRQMNRKPSYMIIEEEDGGRLHFHQAYVDR